MSSPLDINERSMICKPSSISRHLITLDIITGLACVLGGNPATVSCEFLRNSLVIFLRVGYNIYSGLLIGRYMAMFYDDVDDIEIEIDQYINRTDINELARAIETASASIDYVPNLIHDGVLPDTDSEERCETVPYGYAPVGMWQTQREIDTNAARGRIVGRVAAWEGFIYQRILPEGFPPDTPGIYIENWVRSKGEYEADRDNVFLLDCYRMDERKRLSLWREVEIKEVPQKIEEPTASSMEEKVIEEEEEEDSISTTPTCEVPSSSSVKAGYVGTSTPMVALFPLVEVESFGLSPPCMVGMPSPGRM
jgi:hypothetical protein